MSGLARASCTGRKSGFLPCLFILTSLHKKDNEDYLPHHLMKKLLCTDSAQMLIRLTTDDQQVKKV
jgi:hypothetical protein